MMYGPHWASDLLFFLPFTVFFILFISLSQKFKSFFHFEIQSGECPVLPNFLHVIQASETGRKGER